MLKNTLQLNSLQIKTFKIEALKLGLSLFCTHGPGNPIIFHLQHLILFVL